MIITRGKGMRGELRIKGANMIVMEDDLTLDGRHTMQYTDHVT